MSEDDFEEGARLFETGQISRRRFLTRLVAGGASVTAAYALLNAAGPAAFAHTGRRPVRYGRPPRHYGQPVHYGNPPTHYGNPPQHYGNPPRHYGNPPKHYGNPPRHYGNPPKHYGTPPGHYGKPPRSKWQQVGGRRRR